MTQEARPVGPTLAGWEAPPAPGPAVLEGRYARLERLAERHAAGLWEAFAEDAAGAIWTYMPHGPFADEAAFAAWVAAAAAGAIRSTMRSSTATAGARPGWRRSSRSARRTG
jgi:hypothetical protein